MLHRQTVHSDTLDLLIALCSDPEIESFALTGGTALALRFGHRLSVDLDFFTPEAFETEALLQSLAQRYGFVPTNINRAGLSGVIRDVKVDFVVYRYPLLQPFETVEGVRLFGIRDNIAMKLSALTNRGAKKDFYDVHRLLRELSLSELVTIYQEKYPSHDAAILLRSMLYFDDADEDLDPVTLDGTRWEQVKTEIVKVVRTVL